MKTIKKVASLIVVLIAMMGFNEVKAQMLKAGIYAPDPNASVTTNVELKNDVLITMYAGKYETKYKKTNGIFISENGKQTVTIASTESYKVSNSEGITTVMTLVLELPNLDKKDLQEISLPTGKGYITQRLPFNIEGNYKFDGSANVITQINADGTGKFQYAIDSDNAGQLFDIKWGVLCSDSGQHLASFRNGVSAYTLMIYTTKWEAISLQFAKKAGKVVINRDRLKNIYTLF